MRPTEAVSQVRMAKLISEAGRTLRKLETRAHQNRIFKPIKLGERSLGKPYGGTCRLNPDLGGPWWDDRLSELILTFGQQCLVEVRKSVRYYCTGDYDVWDDPDQETLPVTDYSRIAREYNLDPEKLQKLLRKM
jgi:hypothetical protein